MPAVAVLLGAVMILGGGGVAGAAVVPTVGLGTSAAYGALGGSTVTNTGTSVINGLDVAVSPGTAVTGFPPGLITGPGTIHQADAQAAAAQSAALTAFNDAAGRVAAPADQGLTDLVGKTLQPGVYQGNLSLGGTLILDNRTDPDAVFIFQASSTLITASSSVITFTTPHASCNVFWEVGTSATLGTDSRFVGTVLAHTSITAQTGATVTGRLLAATGAVTLDTNVITAPACAAPTTTSDAPTTPTTPTGTSTVGTGTSSAPNKSSGPVTAISPPNENTTPTTIPLLSTTPAAAATSTTISAPNENTTPSTIPLLSTTPAAAATSTTISPPNENTTPSTIALLTTTQDTTGTATSAAAMVLTQPSFPTGVSAGYGPPKPMSPISVIGAALLVLGALALLWRVPAARRLLTGLHRSSIRTGKHR